MPSLAVFIQGFPFSIDGISHSLEKTLPEYLCNLPIGQLQAMGKYLYQLISSGYAKRATG